MRNEVFIKPLIVLLIISGYVIPAIADDDSLPQWGNGISGRLVRGEELLYNGYTVKVIDFPAPVKSNSKGAPVELVDTFVGINISKNGQFLNKAMMKQDDYYIAPDGEIKITAKLLPSREGTEWVFETYAPWAVLEICPRGIPGIKVLVETDNSVYISSANTEITVSVTIKNTGSANLLNADAEIITSLPLKRGMLNYHYESIKNGESLTKSVVLAAPFITESKNYVIIVNSTGYDARDTFYTAQSSKSIKIAPEPAKIPTITKSVNPKIYLEEHAMVSISLKNKGNFEIQNVSVTDSIPDGFELLSNNSMQWNFTLPPNGEWDTRYLIRPTKANKSGAKLPPAKAEFRTQREYHTIRSNQPSIVIHGPEISLIKQVNVSSINQGDIVTVTVSAENVGSTPTKVFIKDQLPSEATFVSGATNLTDFLEANRTASFSYIIRIDSELPVKLPSATAEYNILDAKSGTLTATSNEPEILIRTPETREAVNPENTTSGSESPEPAPAPVPTPELPVTSIIKKEEVKAARDKTTPDIAIMRLRISYREIDSIMNLMLGCNSTSSNESIIACSLVKAQ